MLMGDLRTANAAGRRLLAVARPRRRRLLVRRGWGSFARSGRVRPACVDLSHPGVTGSER
jgi:hypothetical protein